MTLSNFITNIFRVFTGVLFIFSGFVKLVDPLGSAYKFEEYFGSDVLNLEFLIPYALPFSIILIMIELFLGIAILIGSKTKFTLWSLFFLTTLFLFLTWYSAFYNKVTDCGCFGDAIKLGLWETFIKNVVFIIIITILLFNKKHIQPIFTKKLRNLFLLISLFASSYIAYYSLNYLPIIDFRAYAVGKNLREGMEYNEDGETPVHDFYLESDTDDLTDAILDAPKALLIVANHLEDSPTESWESIIEFTNKAKENGYLVYALSSGGSATVKETINKNNIPFEILFCDGTALKTMCRANPGVVILEKATVTYKESWKKLDNIQL